MRPVVTDRLAWSICLSVCLSLSHYPAKTAAPIEIPFGLRTRVGPGNYVLDGVQILHGKGQFWGGKGRPIVKCRDTLRSSERNDWTDRDAVWVVGSDGPYESCVRWGSRAAEERCHGNHLLAFYVWAAHWRHLANTTEASMCGGDAALCQITLPLVILIIFI